MFVAHDLQTKIDERGDGELMDAAAERKSNADQ